jgi:hypothetical protein
MTEFICDTISTTIAKDSITNPALQLPFEDIRFFQGGPLHPEVKVGQTGFMGTPRAYQLWRDEWVVLFVLVCFLLLALIQKRLRKQLSSEAKEFFFPSKNITRKDKCDRSFEQLMPLLLAFILSIMAGLGVFMYTQKELDLFLGQVSPYMLIVIYIGIWILYFVFKNLLAAFVNWIFFDKSKRELWRKSFFFLFTAESLLFFLVISSTIFLNLPLAIPLWIILAVGLLIKILHLYKTFLIFFPKFYGTLHLIVYFCTLEIMPLVAVFEVLIRVTDELIVKF